MERELGAGQVDLLHQLAATPLVDRIELAALSGRSTAGVYLGLAALCEQGLVESLPHAGEFVSGARRFLLSSAGLERLARERGASLKQLLAELPVSDEWRRNLIGRLDGAAVICRLAAALAEAAYPIRLRWYRSSPADAAAALGDGRTLALLRLGRGVERTAAALRLRRLGEGPRYSAALILVSDGTRLRHLRRIARGLPFSCLLALERHAARAAADDAVWVPAAGGPALSLEDALGFVRSPGEWARERPPLRRSAPRPLGEHAAQGRLLPSRLGPAEKRSLDLIADWPWLGPDQLEGLLGVGRRRVSQLTRSLEELELVRAPRLEGRRRLALTDRALVMLARRDRSSAADARRRWSAGPNEVDGAAFDWRDIPGRRSRQLLRHLDHTEAVHGFAAALAAQARGLGMELSQLDPPHRASRYFRHEGGLRSIHPDAFILLRSGGELRPAFLEWERRAIRPRTMRTRLAPYLRYFASRRPVDDHGAQPQLWVVFDDPLAADRFLTVARSELARTRVELPLLVSDRERIHRLGPLGPAWRGPGGWEQREPFAQD